MHLIWTIRQGAYSDTKCIKNCKNKHSCQNYVKYTNVCFSMTVLSFDGNG